MRNMKRAVALFALALRCVCAQGQNVEGQIVAAQYGVYQITGYSDETSTTGFTFPAGACQVSGGGNNFSGAAAGIPIKIVDGNPAHTEIATPSAVNIDACTVTVTTTYNHQLPYFLTSGTGGLQEAINANGSGRGANTVILTAEWYSLVPPGVASSVISSVTGNTSLGLVDVTTTPYTTYSWNGSAYVANGTGSGSVNSVSVTTANGVSGTVATPNTTPAISLTLGAITPASVTASGGLIASSDGVHAGYSSLAGNTANQAVTANTAGWMGPNLASFTAYALQMPSSGPSGGYQVVSCPAPTSGVSTCIFPPNVYIDNSGNVNISGGFNQNYAGDHLGGPGQSDIVGQITLTSATSNSYTFTTAYYNPPWCQLTPTSDPTALGAYWVTTTAAAITAHVHTSGTITFTYECRADNY
jgi:hypothetical protein